VRHPVFAIIIAVAVALTGTLRAQPRPPRLSRSRRLDGGEQFAGRVGLFLRVD
jgi:hypothetical protein